MVWLREKITNGLGKIDYIWSGYRALLFVWFGLVWLREIACIHTYLFTPLPQSLPSCLLLCLPPYLPASLMTHRFACLPVYCSLFPSFLPLTLATQIHVYSRFSCLPSPRYCVSACLSLSCYLKQIGICECLQCLENVTLFSSIDPLSVL